MNGCIRSLPLLVLSGATLLPFLQRSQDSFSRVVGSTAFPEFIRHFA